MFYWINLVFEEEIRHTETLEFIGYWWDLDELQKGGIWR
jgi:hypothetical protein